MHLAEGRVRQPFERAATTIGCRRGGRMRRRELMLLVGGAAFAWPLDARAQQSAIPVIGFLSSASPNAYGGRVAAFRKGLSESGYIDG